MHFKVYTKFFYYKLNADEREIYDKLLDGWLDYKETITIAGPNKNVNYSNIIKYVCYDYPELFYVDFGKIGILVSTNKTVFESKFLYTREQSEQIKLGINNVITRIQSLCRNNDVERVIHDYLVQNVRYSTNKSSADAHNVKGALIDGSAVCEGYAKAFKLLCDAVDLPCVLVTGTANGPSGGKENHAWNIIRNHKGHYQVDVTWDSGINNTSGIPLYYNVPDSYIAKDHVWQKNFWPECNDSSEIDKIVTRVRDMNELVAVIVNMSKIRQKKFVVQFDVKFESTNHVMRTVKDAITAAHIRVSAFSAAYLPGIDCAIIGLNY